MRPRTFTMIVGLVALLGMLACSVVGGGGYLAYRQFQRQQQEIVQLRATVVAGAVQPAPTRAPAPAREAAPTAPTTTAALQPTEAPQPATPRAGAPAPAPPASATPRDQPTDVAPALTAEARGALAQHTMAPLYRIHAQFDPTRRVINATQTVRVTNAEAAPLNELYFRLVVNAPHYAEGGIEVTEIRVDGQAAATSLEMDDTALKVGLAQPLAPGQSVEVAMHFTTTIPSSGGGHGIFNASDGVFALYNWHPELAVYENGGWQLNPITGQGDPTNTDVANYSVTLIAPPDYTIVTSGREVPQPNADQTTHHIVSALTRNFVMVASNRFKVASKRVGPTTVNTYYLPGSDAGGTAALAAAAEALELFSRTFGPYPYPELDVTQVPLRGNAAGMESTGLIMIGSSYYDPSQANLLDGLDALVKGANDIHMLDFIVAHETAHQWWYGVVGSDAYAQPWLDEGLANWSAAFYLDETAGQQPGLLARDLFITTPYQLVLASGDMRLDQPVDRFDELQYAGVVYGKGALMYDVLRQQLGATRFNDFLRRYYQQHQFKRVDGREWMATLAQIAGPDAAAAFYQKWVEGASITQKDLPPGGPLSDMLSGLGGFDQRMTPAGK